MTQMAELMGWNGTVDSCRDNGRLFDFPKRVLRSVRFGVHDCVMGDTMQIIPVRKGDLPARVEESRRPAPVHNARILDVPEQYLRNVHSWFNV